MLQQLVNTLALGDTIGQNLQADIGCLYKAELSPEELQAECTDDVGLSVACTELRLQGLRVLCIMLTECA